MHVLILRGLLLANSLRQAETGVGHGSGGAYRPDPTLPPFQRPHRWSEESLVECMRHFERRHGRRPTFNDSRSGAPFTRELPGYSPVERVFGPRNAWSNMMVAAFGFTHSNGSWNAKDDDTLAAIREVEAGSSFVAAARRRNMTGQALARRIKRYKEVFGA